jgi:hypothetical protein
MTFSGNPLVCLIINAYFCTVVLKQDAYEEVIGYFS